MTSCAKWEAFDDLARAIVDGPDEARQHEIARKAAQRLVADPDGVADLLVGAARRIEQHRAGMANRLVIGQAQGLLMGWLDLDADQAFAYLKRRSMHENRKLREVARDIVTTRERPRAWDPAGGARAETPR